MNVNVLIGVMLIYFIVFYLNKIIIIVNRVKMMLVLS